MKVFFGLLLIVNIGFAVFQWLAPYDQLFVEQKKIPAAEKLQLLTDASGQDVSEAEVVARVEAETDALAEAVARIEKEVAAQRSNEAQRSNLVTEDSSDKRVCYTIGPFKDRARAIEISGRYSGKQAEIALKSSLEKEYQGVMVYIEGHETRADAVNTANILAANGITDHIIVNNPDKPNILSLGVFGLKRNADRLKARVEKLKFKVETEPRYREHTIYWIYAEQSSEADLLELLGAGENDSGISQIPTQCLPS
ncbi:MAG: hypothetical protein OEN02_09710 [Gammaproteobacteria bacterium]|nr:hypothetical protein [Gammaproteobacteria bacterium]MDH3537071.1 hypothetical protein [Gammaproteobacteria bacterium]